MRKVIEAVPIGIRNNSRKGKSGLSKPEVIGTTAYPMLSDD